MSGGLPTEALEAIYLELAALLDRVPAGTEANVLARLVLLVAERTGDGDAVLGCIAALSDAA